MWWNGILTRENERRLAKLDAEMMDAYIAIQYWRATLKDGATSETLAKIDAAIREQNNRYWKAFTAHQALMKSTPS